MVKRRIRNQINKIISMRKKGILPWVIFDELGISRSVYSKRLKMIKDEKIVNKREFKELIYNKPKLNKKTVKKIVYDRIIRGMFKSDIMIKYNMEGDGTFSIAMKKGVEYGYLTEEDRRDSEEYFSSLGHERKIKKHGKKKASELCSKARDEGIGNDLNALESAARAGGLATQEKHAARVQKNLRHAEHYGNYPKWKYKGIEYASKGELWLGLILLISGKLKKVKEGINYQVHFGNGRKRADFAWENNGKKEAADWHPIAKGIGDQNYVKNRSKELLEYFDKVYVLEKQNDACKIGLIKIPRDYFRIKRMADKKIEKIKELSDDLAEVPF